MPKCDFNKVAKQHIFRTLFLKNTSEWLLWSKTLSYTTRSDHRRIIWFVYIATFLFTVID